MYFVPKDKDSSSQREATRLRFNQPETGAFTAYYISPIHTIKAISAAMILAAGFVCTLCVRKQLEHVYTKRSRGGNGAFDKEYGIK